MHEQSVRATRNPLRAPRAPVILLRSAMGRPSLMRLGAPIVNVPAGIRTISGYSAQSRNVSSA